MFSKYNHIKYGGPSKHGDELLPEVTIPVMKNTAKYLNACKQTIMSIKEAHTQKKLMLCESQWRITDVSLPTDHQPPPAMFICHGTDLKARVVVTPQYKRESYVLNLGAQLSPRFLLD